MEEPLSSSVVEESSSSFDKAFKGSLWRTGAYKAFVDPRDNREYYYIQITGEDTAGKAATIKVMAENLNVGEFIRGRKNQEDDTKIERYCYDNDTTNCNKYGGLYQWAEMMQLPSRCNTESCADMIKPNHQGICPSGWRLLTYNDYYIVVHADNNEDGVEGTRAGRFGGSNDSGYSLISTGYLWDHSFTNVENGTYWHYPVESDQYNGIASKVSSQWRTATGNSYDDSYKTQGFSVRCVMVE
ncbi:major paralogous domain-containing protein [Fibrobacter sp. UWH4]|nr:major paralogous domain-containing protein [Fibrobacter sp. UWH4]